MPGSADKFLDLLQERKLLPQITIDGLRKQIAASPDQFSAHHVAKLLQRKGKITAFQSRELLAEVEGQPAAQPQPDQPSETVETQTAENGGELGLLEEDDDKTVRKKSKIAARTKSDQPSPLPEAAPKVELESTPSGIDDLLDDPLVQSGPAADPLLLSPKKKKGWFSTGQKTGGKRQAAGWDSPLMIVGGGMLLLLILAGSILAFVLLRGSGDDLHAAAEADYLAGSYSQAIGKYEKFVAGHSSHPKASLARVRIGLAKMRIAAADQNWAGALETAEEVLPGIAREPAFDQARPELAGMLPDVAQGFAEKAANAEALDDASENVAKFRRAIKLIDDPTYLPASQRATLNARVQRLQEKVAGVVREIEKRGRLQEAIAKINAEAEDPMEAYQHHEALLKLYPQLADDPGLSQAIRSVSAKLVSDVTLAEETIESTAEPRQSPVVAEAALADLSGGEIEALSGHVFSAIVDGVLYALDAGDGKLLWRKFVGPDSTQVIPIGESPGADLLVFHARDNDLLRLKSNDGALVWRLPVGQHCEMSLASDSTLLLSFSSGQLWEVDIASGTSRRQVIFPQPLSAAAVAGERSRIYQLGDHSNLYVLHSQTLQCDGVFYLGHKRATIQYAPLPAAGFLAVAENHALRQSRLHLLRETNQAPLLETAQLPVLLEGHFGSPLIAEQTRIAAVASDGAATLLEIDPAAENAPMSIIAKNSGGQQRSTALAVMRQGYLLVGNRRLASYRTASARGALSPRWVNHDGDTFVGSMWLIGDHLIHVRREPGKPGVVVAATARDADNPQDAGRPVWENRIAGEAPQGGLRLSPGEEQLHAFTSSGALYELSVDMLKARAVNSPAKRPLAAGDYTRVEQIRNGSTVLLGPRMSHFGRDNVVQSDSPGDLAEVHFELATPWRQGLLAPTRLGSVVFLPGAANSPRLYPFQPRLVVGETYQWSTSAAVNESQFLITRSAAKLADAEATDLFLVAVSEDGAPHLTAAAQIRIEGTAVSAPLLMNQHAVVVVRSADRDSIQHFALPELELATETELSGRLRWGPHSVADVMLLATEPGGLIAYSSQGEQVWTLDLERQQPVAKPISLDDDLIVATSAGHVLRLDPTDGSIDSQVVLGEPISDGPFALRGAIAVRVADGSVLRVDNP